MNTENYRQDRDHCKKNQASAFYINKNQLSWEFVIHIFLGNRSARKTSPCLVIGGIKLAKVI